MQLFYLPVLLYAISTPPTPVLGNLNIADIQDSFHTSPPQAGFGDAV